MSNSPESTHLKIEIPDEPDNDLSDKPEAEVATQPFFYEIRVKGRLSQEKWTSWFDNLTITAQKGETILRGTLADHAALYGLIARLRDLAVPLLSVNVLDAEAQRKLWAKSKRYNLLINLLLVSVYLLLLGSLISLTVFISSVIHEGLALTLLFAVLGVLSYIFYIWYGGKFWRFLAYLLWPASVLTFFIYLAVAEIVHPALSITTLFVLAAGGLIYLVNYVRGRAEKVDDLLVDWETIDGPTEPAGTGELPEKAPQDERL